MAGMDPDSKALIRAMTKLTEALNRHSRIMEQAMAQSLRLDTQKRVEAYIRGPESTEETTSGT
jgi:hypothetical protein